MVDRPHFKVGLGFPKGILNIQQITIVGNGEKWRDFGGLEWRSGSLGRR
jgi:hypothetical protein